MRVTLTMNSRGTITLPRKLRDLLGLKGEDHLIAEATDEGLLLRPAAIIPIELYSSSRIAEFEAAEAELEEYLSRPGKP